MNAGDLLVALKDRWRLAALIAALLFAIIALWIVLQPRTYTATASLLFDVTQPDPSLSDQERTPLNGANLLGTQSDVLTSNFVARTVAEKLDRLEGRPRANDAQLAGEANALLQNVVVLPGKLSNVLDVAATDPDPDRAARIANLFVGTYLEKQRDLREIAARGYAAWLDDRTRDVRARLVAAQNRLADYQRAHGVIGANRMDLEAERLRSLNTELAGSEADAAKAGATARSGTGSDVEFSGLVQQLKGEIATQSAKIADMARTLGPNNPDLIAARAQLSTLEQQLGAARGSAAAALSANSNAAERREAELRGRMQSQQQRMIALSKDQQDLAILQQDVDAAQLTYDSVRKRYGEVVVRSVISQTNASQLDHATPPSTPSHPNVPLLVALALLLSVAVGASAVIGFELLDPRVRTQSGVAAASGRNVVADYSGKHFPGFGRFSAGTA